MLISNIEDLILFMCDPVNKVDHSSIDPKDKGIIFSMSAQLKKFLPFTIRQSELVLKILIRNQTVYTSINGFNMLIEKPSYKYSFRNVDLSKKIYLTTHLDKKVIGVKFPFDSKTNNVVSALSGKLAFDKNSRSHLFELTETNILKIVKDLSDYDFTVDQQILDWYEEIIDILNNPSEHLPTLDFNGELFLTNANNTLNSFFDENKNGEFLHDTLIAKIARMNLSNSVLTKIKETPASETTKKILSSTYNKFDTKMFEGDIKGIFKFLSEVTAWPVMIILSDNNNVDKTITEFYTYLSNLGIESDDMCVLFRSVNNKNFNAFVRDNGLNTLLSDKTKVVFIKHKIPKLLYKLDFKPNVIVTGFSYHAHYTTQKMVDHHPFLLYYTDVRNVSCPVVS